MKIESEKDSIFFLGFRLKLPKAKIPALCLRVFVSVEVCVCMYMVRWFTTLHVLFLKGLLREIVSYCLGR